MQPPGPLPASREPPPGRVPAGARCGLRRRVRRRAPRPRPLAPRALPGPAARAPRRRSPPLPSPPLPPPPRPRPGTLAGPERERRRHLSCCRCLQRSAASAEGRAPAARARGPASRRRPLLGPQCSPRCQAAGPGPREPRSAPRARPCRSRLGPTAAPGARAMLRRPAPALAPAAWLLLAGLLCGGGVWAARGKRRGRAGARGGGSGRGVRGRAQEAVGARGRRPGKPGCIPGGAPGPWPPPGSPGGGCADVGGRAYGLKGRSTFPCSARSLGVPPRGEVPCTCVVCSEVHQAGGACTLFGVSLHKSPLLRILFRDPGSLLLRRGHRIFAPFRLLPGSFKRLFSDEPRLKLLAPLPPCHPKVKS